MPTDSPALPPAPSVKDRALDSGARAYPPHVARQRKIVQCCSPVRKTIRQDEWDVPWEISCGFESDALAPPRAAIVLSFGASIEDMSRPGRESGAAAAASWPDENAAAARNDDADDDDNDDDNDDDDDDDGNDKVNGDGVLTADILRNGSSGTIFRDAETKLTSDNNDSSDDQLVFRPVIVQNPDHNPPGTIYVKHGAPLSYIGTSRSAERPLEISLQWIGYDHSRMSDQRLIIHFVSDAGVPTEAALDTGYPFVAVAITFLVRFHFLQLRYHDSHIYFVLVERLKEANILTCDIKSSAGATAAGAAGEIPAGDDKKYPRGLREKLEKCDTGRAHVSLAIFSRWLIHRIHGAGMYENIALDVAWLYNAVRRTPDDDDADEYKPHLSFVASVAKTMPPTLRPYQERAVAWMLSRERVLKSATIPLADPEGQIWANPAIAVPDSMPVIVEESDLQGPARNWVCFSCVDDPAVVSDFTNSASAIAPVTDVCVHPRSGEVLFGVDTAPKEDVREQFIANGGLLCDEMGLGKTVEVITLVAANPRRLILPPAPKPIVPESPSGEVTCVECGKGLIPCSTVRVRERSVDGSIWRLVPIEFDARAPNIASAPWVICRDCQGFAHKACFNPRENSYRRGFVCQGCAASYALDEGMDPVVVPSNATLVVVPQILLSQWVSELKLHGRKDFNVVVFDGLAGQSGFVGRNDFVRADVVLTTYDALRSDCSIVGQMRSTRRLRKPKRYRPTPTPLLSVEWWRVLLDEGQLMENGASAQAMMAKELWAVHRWCVTGTPARKSIDELSQMLSYLRCLPCLRASRWMDEMVGPAESGSVTDRARLATALRQLVWRTGKKDVEGTELCLPPQTTYVCRVQFGPVEKVCVALCWPLPAVITISSPPGL
jgi:SNF2-related domain